MEISEMVAGLIACRCVLILPQSLKVASFADAGQDRLPRIHIAPKARSAQEVQRAVKARWGLDIFVLEIWEPRNGVEACAVVELLVAQINSPFKKIPAYALVGSELSEQEYCRVRMVIEGTTNSPFSRLGWVDQAIAWLESATRRTFSTKQDVEQWNAGAGFVLLRLRSDDDRCYWLKATGEPNAHEFLMIRFLSEAYPDFVPKLVAIKKEWNAWLTEDAGCPLSESPTSTELFSAAKRLATLQLLTVGETDELLAAGAFDQRLSLLRGHIDAIIAYLIEAMARQKSTKAAPLSRDRLHNLGEILRDACFGLEALGIPDALIHNDLNPSNILSDGANYVFTDWSEAAVGNPFLTCERLCQLNRAHAESVRNVYRECWSHQLSAQSIDDALALTPLLAIYAYLYGRGEWLRRTERLSPEFESYGRSLARHMDRVAKNSALLEVRCR